MAKWLDYDGLSHFWSKLKTLLNNKVDKADGKGLSTNDFTGNYKSKLDGIAAGAQVNVLEGIQVNGTTVTPTNKIANIDISGKVDKVTGKGLSTNDYTTAEKNKLSGIDTGAEVNVIESITVDGKAQTITNKAVALDLSAYATDSEVSTIKKNLEDQIAAVEAGGISLETSITNNDSKAISAGAVYRYQASNDEAVAKKIDASVVESTYAKKSDITNVYKYKGSKATVSALPTTGNVAGDVWNVEERGINYAWTGSVWDPLGELFNIDAITNSEIDTICV